MDLTEPWPLPAEKAGVRPRPSGGDVVERLRSGAGPRRRLALIRAYWRRETSRPYVRDVTVGGDASRLRPDPGTRIGSTLRNLTLTLIHRQGATTRAEARRFFATPVHALALVVSPPSTICRPCANSPKKGLDERGQKA